jgi:hypothetical protein
MFWNNSSDLYNYEMMFNRCGGGIVPLSATYKKITANKSLHIQYPEPLFTIPTLGNQTLTYVVIAVLLGISGFIIVKKY